MQGKSMGHSAIQLAPRALCSSLRTLAVPAQKVVGTGAPNGGPPRPKRRIGMPRMHGTRTLSAAMPENVCQAGDAECLRMGVQDFVCSHAVFFLVRAAAD